MHQGGHELHQKHPRVSKDVAKKTVPSGPFFFCHIEWLTAASRSYAECIQKGLCLLSKLRFFRAHEAERSCVLRSFTPSTQSNINLGTIDIGMRPLWRYTNRVTELS